MLIAIHTNVLIAPAVLTNAIPKSIKITEAQHFFVLFRLSKEHKNQ